METFSEHNQPLYAAFIDIAKAYNGISRKALLAVLRRYGSAKGYASLSLCRIARPLVSKVRIASEDSDVFDIESGINQGCILFALPF